MMRCIAVDDEPLALKLLIQYCEKIPFIELLGAYTDPLDALSYIKIGSPDLLFLDIRMPDLSGMEMVRLLSGAPLVIFTTAHKEHAVESFELDVVDYLLKPFGFDRFQKACLKAEERFRSKTLRAPEGALAAEASISFKHHYQTIRLPIDSIHYIEASNNHIKIVAKQKVYTPLMTMKSVWNILPEDQFVRVHKSYILPINKIRSFSHEKVVTETKQIPIGRVYLKSFINKMKTYRG